MSPSTLTQRSIPALIVPAVIVLTPIIFLEQFNLRPSRQKSYIQQIIINEEVPLASELLSSPRGSQAEVQTKV